MKKLFNLRATDLLAVTGDRGGRMVREYPRAALIGALAEAGHYGLFDLERVERMVLRRVARDYFPPDTNGDENDD